MPLKFINSLGYFDFFGVTPTLYYNGGGKSKSGFGSVCSYIMIAYMILAIMYSFSDMILRNNPRVVTSVVKGNPNGVPFNTNGFNLGLGFLHGSSITFNTDTGIYQFRILSYDVEYEEGGGKLISASPKSVSYENCTKEHFNNQFTEVGYCIKKDQNVTLGSLNAQPLIYVIGRCENGTSQEICQSKEQIDEAFSTHLFWLTFPKYLVTPDNYENPISIQRGSHVVRGTTELSKDIIVEIMEYEIHTDSGFIFSDVKVENFIQIEKVWVDTAKYVTWQIQVRMELSSSKTIIKRSYPKIQEGFAGAVALVKIGFLACVFLIVPCAKINYFQQIINKVFNDSTKNYQFILSSNNKVDNNNSEFKFSYAEYKPSTTSSSNKYENVQSSGNSSMVGSNSPIDSKVQQSPKNDPNKLLRNAILSNQKDVISEEGRQTQREYLSNEISQQSQIQYTEEPFYQTDTNRSEVIDENKIVLELKEEGGGHEIIQREDSIKHMSKSFEKSKEVDKENLDSNTLQHHPDLQVDNSKILYTKTSIQKNQKQSSFILWAKTTFSCLKNQESKLFKERQKFIKKELSMSNLLKKLIEFDRLKNFILDPQQLNLFNNIPFSQEQELKEQFNERELLQNNLMQIQNKEKKDNIDHKILEYYIKK